MKSYTDLRQSKKLAEILPIESADMCWCNNSIKGVNYTDDFSANLYTVKEMKDVFDTALNGWDKYWELIPCWSLAALMEILSGAAFTRGGTAPEYYEVTIFYTDETPKLKSMTCTGTSYVDACYKMIMKLHEMNILTLLKTMEEQS